MLSYNLLSKRFHFKAIIREPLFHLYYRIRILEQIGGMDRIRKTIRSAVPDDGIAEREVNYAEYKQQGEVRP